MTQIGKDYPDDREIVSMSLVGGSEIVFELQSGEIVRVDSDTSGFYMLADRCPWVAAHVI